MAVPTFNIIHTDGTKDEVKLLPLAQMRYEKETKRSLIGEVGSLSEMYELAWYAAGKPGKLMEWIETVEAVEPGDEDDADPTSTEQSPD